MSDPKDSRLSRIYREGAWPEPNRQIDQAILAASRRAARERHSFAKRWVPAFAVAATVVLTSAIVLKAVREQPEVVSPSVPDKETGIRATRSMPAAEPKEEKTKPAPAAAEQPAPTPQGFSSTMDAAEAARVDRLRRDLDLKGPPPSESPRPAPKSALAEKPASALKKEASDSLQRRPDVTQSQSVRAVATPPREQRPPSAPVSVFGAPPPAQAPASAPAPASPPAPSAPPSAAATSGAVTSALSAGAAKAPERTPQAWIEDIRKLMKAGMSEEAGGELAEFKKRYPDYVLPEDLR